VRWRPAPHPQRAHCLFRETFALRRVNAQRNTLDLVFVSNRQLCAPGRAQVPDETRQLAHDIFKQLIEINTTDSVGNVTTAAEAMANRLRDAGFAEADIKLAGPNERKRNLVARFRGTGKRKPILFIGTLTSSKPSARTGPPIPSNSLRRTATSTVAAPKT